MCTLKILNKTSHGQLLFCPQKDLFQLLFNNLNFNLSRVEMYSFTKYLKHLNIDYWEKEYENSVYEKKIPIPTLLNNFIILLDRKEVEELRFLLCVNQPQQFLSSLEIDYIVIYN